LDLILGKYQKNAGGMIGGLSSVTSDEPQRFRILNRKRRGLSTIIP
jgi:hypothetical protein